MAGIDRLLQHPAIEMQPGELPVDKALGAAAHRGPGIEIYLFFFNYNGLHGFHQVLIHLKTGGMAIRAKTAQSMCDRDDVSMTMIFPPRAPSRCKRRPVRYCRGVVPPPAPG